MAKIETGNGIAAKLRKTAVYAAVALVLVLAIFLLTGARVEDFSDRWYGHDLTVGLAGRQNTYARYLARVGHVPLGTQNRPVDITSWSDADGASLLVDFEGESLVLRTEERGFVEFTVYLEQAGLYNLHVEYFPLEARGIDIERRVRINGEIPFLGADRLMFRRVWGDVPGGRRMDNQGNEVRASQIEFPRWESAWFRDILGYNVDPYKFYFSAGYNTIRLEGVNEPMAIRSFMLKAPSPPASHAEFLAGFNLNEFRNSDTRFMMRVQGEDAIRRSDPSLAPVHDRSSGATYPPAPSRIRFNMIGGHPWRVAGQWIEWEFEVPEDGMYRISIKARQNYNRGFVSNRAIMINGEVPSRELSAVPFMFNNRWQLVTLSDDYGEYLFFPLRAGTNTIRMEVVMGRLGEMLTTIEESVYRLNEMYRQILVLTGPNPDPFRDYRIEAVYPHLIPAMELESRILYRLVDDLTAYSGERSPQTAAAMTLARQLEIFSRRPDRIPRQLVNFRQNVSSLGDSLLALAQGQLDVDYIVISGADAELPATGESFLVDIAHEFRSFIASFFMDFDSLGDVHEGEGVITVWMLAGREQSTILKRMIDDTFTPDTGIMVNVRLVAPEALMPAVVAGIGPDLALTVQQGDPVNYALRNAVVDLSQFPGFEETAAQFHEGVITPFRFQGGVFGLPETQFFHVMFYRRDIMEELEITPPRTWDELISILPVIQRNNMNVGIPSVAGVGVAADFSNFLAHLFQRGGNLYNADGSRTMLDSEIAIEAFDFYTQFFTHFRTPMVFDFVNRFRSGEMPLAFADYTNFNVLEVFAPEIRGLWGFGLVPGLPQERCFLEYGQISAYAISPLQSHCVFCRPDSPEDMVNRSISTGSLASMIFTRAEREGRDLMAWEFLRWWLSTETQLRFGRELESIIGSAARHPTANIEAFRRLPWGTEQMAILDEQRSWAVGVPEVPGGYLVGRHITNATRRILTRGDDTRETLLDFTLVINDELRRKRLEFGLPIYEGR